MVAANQSLKMFWRYVTGLFVVWTVAIGASFAWNFYQIDAQTKNLALKEAFANFDKDQGFRDWGTRRGVYVPITRDTPPSPYMAHIPERDIVTPSGKKLTLLNPAYMVRQLMEDYASVYGVKGKITGLILLRPENAPDEWERRGLHKLKSGALEIIDFANIGGAPYLRVMRPMMMKPGCDKCHGHLGFKTGDFRGGVSVSIPMAPYLNSRQSALSSLAGSHGLIWILGVGLIGFGSRRIKFSILENQSLNAGLEDRVERRTADLTASEARLSSIMNSAADGIITIDERGIIETVNPATEVIFGYAAAELIGQNVKILMPEPDRSDHDGHLAKYKLTGEANIIGTGRDTEGKRKDGTVFPLHLAVGEAQVGARRLYTGMLQDITQRKQAEERFRNIFENSNIAMTVTNLDGRFVQVNPAFCAMMGYQLEEVLELSVAEITHPDDRNNTVRARQSIIEKRFDDSQSTKRYVRKDGAIVWGLISRATLSDKDGKPEFVVGQIQDITERVAAEAKLEESEQNFRALFENARDGIYLLDPETRLIADVNKVGAERLGYTKDEIVGEPVSKISFNARDDTGFRGRIDDVVSGNNTGVVNRTHVRKDGTQLSVEVNNGIVRRGGRELVQSIARDITDRIEYQKELESSKALADAASKSKSDILASMSHELRTPLNAILGFSGAMKQRVFGALGHEKYEEYVHDIGASGEHLLELINDVLDVSAIEADKLELHDDALLCEEVISAAIRLIKPRADAGNIKIINSSDGPGFHLRADERRLKQIVINLLSNAVKFSGSGKPIEITAAAASGQGARITIADQGCGMTAEEIEIALTPFGQVRNGGDDRPEGTGLGLPLTKALIEAHGGTLTIISRPDAGTTITIGFPPDRVLD